MRAWIEASEQMLKTLGIRDSVGFRSPVGIQTPELHHVLNEMRLPLVLWDQRFYDTLFRFTPQRALRSLRHTQSGSIVLLHDAQRPSLKSEFLRTLPIYLAEAKSQGFRFHGLTRELCEENFRFSGRDFR